jgi:hypothetical protein
MPAGMEVECPGCGAIEGVEWLDYDLLAKVLGWGREEGAR